MSRQTYPLSERALRRLTVTMNEESNQRDWISMSSTGRIAVALTCAGVGLGAVAIAESPAARANVGQFLTRIGAREVLLNSARALVERAVSTIFDGPAAVHVSRSGTVPS